MKIKFIKEYKAFGNLDLPGECMREVYSQNEVVDTIDEVAQWLIDNGFAVRADYGWLYDSGEYYTLGAYCIVSNKWDGSEVDEVRRDHGLAFKTKESAQRFDDYLKAVEIVRHDEGFMPNVPKLSPTWAIGYNNAGVIAPMVTSRGYAGSFRFYSYSQARDSLDKHRDEWKIILNYNWSKGEQNPEGVENKGTKTKYRRAQIKQIKVVHSDSEVMDEFKCVDIDFRYIKDCYYCSDQWDVEHIKAGDMDTYIVDVYHEVNISEEEENVIKYLNQLVRDGYIEIKDNPNIIWEDNNED